VHTPGIASTLAAIDAEGLANVRLVHGDALGFLPRLPPSSLEGVRIFFPDPWPMARHHLRRIVRPDVVAELVIRLRPGGWLHLATDIDDYADQMRTVCGAHPALSAGRIDDRAGRPSTRYERKGIDAGRTAVDLWYNRS
jgi:tRNA (guanine-N7-)-methyltransferase